MKCGHVKKRFLPWSDGNVDDNTRRGIDHHLEDCRPCRSYYEKMLALLSQAEPSAIPRLEADPFLPTRIRSAAGEQSSAVTAGRSRGWLRWSVPGAMAVGAVALGVFLGRDLSTIVTTTDTYSDAEIIEAYYDAFSQSGFASDWESVIETEQEENG